MKSKLRLGIFALTLILATAFTTSVLTPVYYNVTRIGTFWTSIQAFDSTTIGQLGGRVSTYLAGDSVENCSLVYISAKNTVKRDTILTNYNKVAGLVVGGTRTSMQATVDSAGCGTLAATNGQRVVVLVQGRGWVTVDTVGTGFSPGSVLIPSNKQGMRGRVAAKTTAIDSFYRAVGKIVDSGVVNTKRIAEIRIK